MTWLTINIHSWMEEDTEEKLNTLANFIVSNELDGVSLQEVNQRFDSLEEINPLHFSPAENESVIIREDNYALCLVKRLAELGETYYWSWTFSHIGYDVFEEGVAILSKTPLQSNAVLVSSVDDKANINRRMMLCSKTNISHEDIIVTSNHYSWWSDSKTEGFQLEWALTKQFLDQYNCPKLLFGDFNGPDTTKNETYDLVTDSFFDTFKLSEIVTGRYTIPEKIDGWDNNTKQLRIDYAFVSKKYRVKSHEVVFDGGKYPCVSDHYGIIITIDR